MKYILCFSVLLLSSINLSSAASIDGSLDYPSGDTYRTHQININDAPNFSVNMTTVGLAEASLWLFDGLGGWVTDDQFWSGNGFTSIFPGDLSAGDEGMYYLAVSIFGVQPDSLSLNMNDAWEDFTFPGNQQDSGQYSLEITGATVPAPPVLWLLSAGLLMFLRERKKSA